MFQQFWSFLAGFAELNINVFHFEDFWNTPDNIYFLKGFDILTVCNTNMDTYLFSSQVWGEKALAC